MAIDERRNALWQRPPYRAAADEIAVVEEDTEHSRTACYMRLCSRLRQKQHTASLPE